MIVENKIKTQHHEPPLQLNTGLITKRRLNSTHCLQTDTKYGGGSSPNVTVVHYINKNIMVISTIKKQFWNPDEPFVW